MVVPKMTAVRDGSVLSTSIPPSSNASRAAAIAICEPRPMRRGSTLRQYSEGLKSRTSPPRCVRNSEVSNEAMVRIPFSPAISAFQKRVFPVPIGVTSPIPVMTTASSFSTLHPSHGRGGSLPLESHAFEDKHQNQEQDRRVPEPRKVRDPQNAADRVQSHKRQRDGAAQRI